MITELLNINNLLDFCVIELKAKKTGKKYFGIAIKIQNEYYLIKFLTEVQKDAIVNSKKGE